MTKPVRVWLTAPGPNPWKVIIVLEELGVSYEIESIRLEDVKRKPFTDVNPNGRVPGAIIQYLVSQYDTEQRLSYNGLKEQNLCNQWLAFQISGQGPYFGQCTWFTFLHPEKVPSAIERYANEIKRVLGVLEGVLATKAESQWLIGDRITFADLAFVPWNDRLDITLGVPKDEVFEGFPHVAAWHDCMTKRPSWIKAMQIRTRLLDEQGFGSNGMPKGLKQSQNHEGSDVAADKS